MPRGQRPGHRGMRGRGASGLVISDQIYPDLVHDPATPVLSPGPRAARRTSGSDSPRHLLSRPATPAQSRHRSARHRAQSWVTLCHERPVGTSAQVAALPVWLGMELGQTGGDADPVIRHGQQTTVGDRGGAWRLGQRREHVWSRLGVRNPLAAGPAATERALLAGAGPAAGCRSARRPGKGAVRHRCGDEVAGPVDARVAAVEQLAGLALVGR